MGNQIPPTGSSTVLVILVDTSEADDMVGPLLFGMKEGGGRRGGSGSTTIGGHVLSTMNGTAEVVCWWCTASLVIDSIADSIDWW